MGVFSHVFDKKSIRTTCLYHVYPDALIPATGPAGKDLPYSIM